jgi:hypothetical protein
MFSHPGQIFGWLLRRTIREFTAEPRRVWSKEFTIKKYSELCKLRDSVVVILALTASLPIERDKKLWRAWHSLISFNRVPDLLFNLPIFFVILVLGMGLFRLFSEVGAVMAATNLKEAFEFAAAGLLIFFVVLGLFKSLVAYFHEHRLNLTFIMDAVLVFILRQ